MASGLISTTPKYPVVNQGVTPVTTTDTFNQNLTDINKAAPQPVTDLPPSTTPASVSEVAPAAPVAPRKIGENETVAGQLNTLLNSDSRYIQSARDKGMETANSRGLINSSIAAGTSERAAIDAALPIATQDSTVNANAAQSAQTANQDLALTTQKSLLDSAQAKENFGYTTSTNAQNIKANTDLQNSRIALDLSRLDETKRTAVNNAAGPILQQLGNDESKIQMMPDEQMSPEAKQVAIQELRTGAQSRIQTMATLYGYDLDWDYGKGVSVGGSTPVNHPKGPTAANGTPNLSADSTTPRNQRPPEGQIRYNQDGTTDMWTEADGGRWIGVGGGG